MEFQIVLFNSLDCELSRSERLHATDSDITNLVINQLRAEKTVLNIGDRIVLQEIES